MCGGQRQQPQREDQSAILEQARRDRQVQEERMAAMQAAADKRQQETLQMIAETSKQPLKVKTAAEATTPLMRTRQKAPGTTSNIASLRINRTPGTNIGMGASGTNVG